MSLAPDENLNALSENADEHENSTHDHEDHAKEL